MMEREWQGILSKYGQPVTLVQGEERTPVRALIQPALDRGRDQEIPSPLGLGCQDRFLYLGPVGSPLDRDTLVEWKDKMYRARTAHLVGTGVCPHWWAVLYPREEAAL